MITPTLLAKVAVHYSMWQHLFNCFFSAAENVGIKKNSLIDNLWFIYERYGPRWVHVYVRSITQSIQRQNVDSFGYEFCETIRIKPRQRATPRHWIVHSCGISCYCSLGVFVHNLKNYYYTNRVSGYILLAFNLECFQLNPTRFLVSFDL